MRFDPHFIENFADLVSAYRYHFLSIVAHVVILGAVLAVVMMGVFPRYEEFQPMIDEANALNADIERLTSDGLDGNAFVGIATSSLGVPRDSAVFRDMTKLREAIKKPANVPDAYLTWLSDEVQLSEKRNLEIQHNREILSSILPRFISANKDIINTVESENSLTLENFIRYLESRILKQFDLESGSAIGLADIEFQENQAWTSNIGEFSIGIDFRWDIRDIRQMLQFVQSSGQLSIRDGQLSTDRNVNLNETGLSDNLLVNVIEFSVCGWLPPDDPLINEGAVTNGSIRLQFYAQGRSTQEVLLMRRNTVDTYRELLKKTRSYEDYCQSSPLCRTNESVRRAVIAIQDQENALIQYSDQIDSLDRRASEVLHIEEEGETLSLLGRIFESIEAEIADNEEIIENAQK